MSRLRVEGFAISVDGHGAGPAQSLEQPLGVGGMALHEWAFATRTFQQRVLGGTNGETGTDDEFVARGFRGIGAWILGRNMFGPLRGPWPDEHWKGWWGGNPPFHVPVFVLTHHARAPIVMDGGTVFHFVTEGIEAALARAGDAANGLNVRLGGGVATVRQRPARRPGRRAAYRHRAGLPRRRRKPLCRPRSAGTRLSMHRTRAERARHPCDRAQVRVISAPVRKCELPAHTLLEVYQRPGHYVDCYVCQVAGAVALINFVTAFYTSAVFWPVESALVAPNAAPQRR